MSADPNLFTDNDTPPAPSPFASKAGAVHGHAAVDTSGVTYAVDLLKYQNDSDMWRRMVRGKAVAWLEHQGLKNTQGRNKVLSDLDNILQAIPCTYDGFNDYMENVKQEKRARDEAKVVKLDTAMKQGVYDKVKISDAEITLIGANTNALRVPLNTLSMVDGDNWKVLQSFGFDHDKNGFTLHGEKLAADRTNIIEPITVRFNFFKDVNDFMCLKLHGGNKMSSNAQPATNSKSPFGGSGLGKTQEQIEAETRAAIESAKRLEMQSELARIEAEESQRDFNKITEGRTADEQPSAKSIFEDDKTRAGLFARAAEIKGYWQLNMPPNDFIHTAITGEATGKSLKTFKGTKTEAEKLMVDYAKTAFRNEIAALYMDAFGRVTKQDFSTATGFENLDKAMIDGTMTPGEIFDMVIKDIGRRAGTQKQDAPATPSETPQIEATRNDAGATGSGVAPAPAIAQNSPVLPANVIPFPGHTESPVNVFPSDKGEVLYNGVRYNVTMRVGATAETAITLLKEWDHFWQLAKASGISYAGPVMQPAPQPQMSIVQPPAQSVVQPAPVAPAFLPPPPASAQTAAPAGVVTDKAGNYPGKPGSDQIAFVVRTKDQQNGQEIVELYKPVGRFAEHRLRQPEEWAIIAAAMNVQSIQQLQFLERYPVNLTVEWVTAQKMKQNGNYYVNVVAARSN